MAGSVLPVKGGLVQVKRGVSDVRSNFKKRGVILEDIIGILPFSIVFIVFWLAISGIISFIGGWYFLAKKLPIVDEIRTVQQTFYIQSMGLGYFALYRSCITVSFFVEGIKFSPIILFRFLHKPIFVTWADIKSYSTSNFIIKKSVFFLDGRRVVLWGGSAKYLQEKLETQTPSF